MLKKLFCLSLLIANCSYFAGALDISPDAYIKRAIPKTVDGNLKVINDEGTEVNLNKYSGKLIVLYFWQKTNMRSVEGLVRLKKLAALFKHDDDIAFVSVYQPTEIPSVLTEQVIRRKLGIYDVSFYKATDNVISYFNVERFPSTYFINNKFEFIASLPSFWNLMHEDMIDTLGMMLEGRFKTLQPPSLWQKVKTWTNGLFSKEKADKNGKS